MGYKLSSLASAILTVSVMSVTGVYAATNQSGGASVQSSAALSQAKGNKPSELSYWYASNFNQTATLPGFSLGAPSGLVPSWGVTFASINGITQPPANGDNDVDGSASVGFGFGNASKHIGGSLSLGLGSIDASDGGLFERGNFSLTVGHFFTESLTGVSVGIQNIANWNAGGQDPDQSYHASVTQIWANDYLPTIFTAGIGNENFTFQRSTQDESENIGAFGSVAVYVLPQVSLIADYTSGVATAGASVVPVASWPVTVNLSAYDIGTYLENHDTVSFQASISYAYTF